MSVHLILFLLQSLFLLSLQGLDSYHRFVKEYEELVNPPMLKDKSGLNNMDKFSISIGIMAHNEEHWIESCINALRNQNITSGEVEEIFVISSGSTDRKYYPKRLQGKIG